MLPSQVADASAGPRNRPPGRVRDRVQLSDGGACVMKTVLVRRDVTKLGEEWHPVLRAYALAVGRMADLPATDPRSMQYQASVHGVDEISDPPPNDFQGQ